MASSAPEITAVSNPKRKPPIATTIDQRITFFLFIWFTIEALKVDTSIINHF
jgi:hypothetical protein